MFWLNAEPPLNILDILLTNAVFQELIFWLKFVAELNVLAILLTNAVFQAPIGWLNAVAPLNIDVILVLELVFQLPILELPPLLNALAKLNIKLILVTALTLQLPTLPLKFVQSLNVKDKSTVVIVGASVALEIKFVQPLKIELVVILKTPQLAIFNIFNLSPVALN
jgi:hypothetical protein